jgi:hypothetical protein
VARRFSQVAVARVRRGREVHPMAAHAKPLKPAPKLVVGWREWVGLPALGVARVKAKIDTGARTSSIHAWDIEAFRRGGASWVRFEIRPLQGEDRTRVECEAPVADERLVRSSSGHAEQRLVIATTLSLGEGAWPIELALARRDEMGFRMLIGRTALKRRAVVDPSRSFVCSSRDAPRRPRRKG